MDANEVASRRQYREHLLEAVYDITKGAPNHYVGLAALGAKLGISPTEVRLAWGSLLQQGLLKSAGIGPELQVFMTHYGVAEAEELALKRTMVPKGVQSMSEIKVFVSHAAKDATLTKALVECIEGCVEVPDKGIRCSSVPGYKLAPGDVSDEVLRSNLGQCSVVIGLLTEDSLKSGYVIMELGAAWGLNKTTCALLAPNVEFKRLPGPLTRTHAVMIDRDHDMVSVMEVVADKTGWPLRNRAKSTAAVSAFLDAVRGYVASAPGP